jgi:hypothetical protein
VADGSAHCLRGDAREESSHPGPFVDLVAGAGHACGLGPDGIVTCFGANAALVAATHVHRVAKLISSEQHVCGITSLGGVACWGTNGDAGQATPPSIFRDRSMTPTAALLPLSDHGRAPVVACANWALRCARQSGSAADPV